MDQTQLQQKIAEYYAKLPSDVQKSFSGMEWMENLKMISTAYSLTAEQIQILGTETTLAFLGIIHLDEYENNLIKELNLSKELADKMIAEINEKIFKSLRGQLAQTFTTNAEELAKEKYGQGVPLDERFSKMPKEVQGAISNSNYQENLYKVGQKHKLSIEQMGKLEEVVTKVMLGIIHPDKSTVELASALGISADKATELVNDLNEEVFKNIIEVLKNNWGKESVSSSLVNKESEGVKIPIPPYKKAAIVTPPVNLPIVKSASSPAQLPRNGEGGNSESKVMSDAGIEMINERPQNQKPADEKMTMKEDSILVKSGISMVEEKPVVEREHFLPNSETQKKELYDIEHPANTPSSIINQKLRGATAQSANVSDYTLPKMSSSLPPNNKDNYREPIE